MFKLLNENRYKNWNIQNLYYYKIEINNSKDISSVFKLKHYFTLYRLKK